MTDLEHSLAELGEDQISDLDDQDGREEGNVQDHDYGDGELRVRGGDGTEATVEKVQFGRAIQRFVSAAGISAKNREFELSRYVSVIAAAGFRDGLGPDQLDVLVRMITKPGSQLDRNSVGTVIQNLYPQSRVSSGVVVRIVAALGPGTKKVGAATQVQLLRWLISVYEVLEEPSILGKLYGILFSFLDLLSIRAPVCHLLAMVTRRKHIRKYRIQQLLELCYKTGDDPALVALLVVYKDFRPDIVTSNKPFGRSRFREYNPEWKTRMYQIQAHARALDASHSAMLAGTDQTNGFRIQRNVHARNTGSAIPPVSSTFVADYSVTLEEINSARAFVAKIERIEPPTQMVSVLKDPFMWKYLLMQPDEAALDTGSRLVRPDGKTAAIARMDSWIARFFDDQLAGLSDSAGRHGNKPLLEMLQTAAKFTAFFQEIMPVLLRFLKRYVRLQIETANLPFVLDILQFLPADDFDELQSAFLIPLEEQTLCRPEGHRLIIAFYKHLLLHWTSLATTNNQINFFLQPQPDRTKAHPPTCIAALSLRFSSVALSAVASDLADAGAVAAVHQVFQLLPCIAKPLPSVSILPPTTLVEHFLYSPRLSDVASIGSVMAKCKPVLRSRGAVPDVRRFNDLVLEGCDLFWRSHGLLRETDGKRPGAGRSFISSSLREELSRWAGRSESAGVPVQETYSLPSHPAIQRIASGLFSNYCAHQLENTSGFDDNMWQKPNQQSVQVGVQDRISRLKRSTGGILTAQLARKLEEQGIDGTAMAVNWKQFRISLINWLGQAGAGGVGELMRIALPALR